jgi:hypothetical protein
MSFMFDPAYDTTVKSGGAVTMLTAAGTGDNTAITGAAFDRTAYASARLDVLYTCTLTAAKTLTITPKVQTADDLGFTVNVTDHYVPSAQVISASATGVASFGSVNFEKRGAGAYCRVVMTPDLSHTGTDTALVAPMLVMGPSRERPNA